MYSEISLRCLSFISKKLQQVKDCYFGNSREFSIARATILGQPYWSIFAPVNCWDFCDQVLAWHTKASVTLTKDVLWQFLTRLDTSQPHEFQCRIEKQKRATRRITFLKVEQLPKNWIGKWKRTLFKSISWATNYRL